MDIGNLIITGKESVTNTGDKCEYQSTLSSHGLSSTVQAHTDTHRHCHLTLTFPFQNPYSFLRIPPSFLSLFLTLYLSLSCHLSSFVLLPLSHSLALLHPILFLFLFPSLVAYPVPFTCSFLVDHSFPSATIPWNRPLTAMDAA